MPVIAKAAVGPAIFANPVVGAALLLSPLARVRVERWIVGQPPAPMSCQVPSS
jgi:hypothetical protein